MNEHVLLGIDIGTSGTKTVLFSTRGEALASYTGEYPLSQPRNGWAEQDPEDWWRATVDGIQHVLEATGVDPSDISAIGLSGQMHGLVALDRNGKVLRPCIIWADQRTGDAVEAMTELVGYEQILSITANPPMTGFTAAKLMWVKLHEPEIFEQIHHVLLPKDYIRYRLSGEFITDVSDASGMQLMDVTQRVWSEPLLEKLGFDLAWLPELKESQDVAGHVNAYAAKHTGLKEGTIIAGGAADNAAAAIGCGVYEAGRAFTTIGTSAVIYTVTDEPNIDKDGRVHTLCASVPGKWTLMSCTQGAGLSLRWLRDEVCAEERQQAEREGVDPYDIMGREASEVAIGADRLLYLPYLMGERSPILDPDARGVFFGLSAVHETKHLIRAVMEGVAYSQAQCVEIFRENDARIDHMVITGGGGRSPLWRQMLADLYETPVHLLEADQGGALGAAILAGVAGGDFGDIAEACESLIRYQAPIEPNLEQTAAYRPTFELYKDLYGYMSEAFGRLAHLDREGV